MTLRCPWCNQYLDIALMVRPKSEAFDFFVCPDCRKNPPVMKT